MQHGGNNGQITGITDNVDATRSMTYSYDALGRLKVAFAGPEASPTWNLDWDYGRYGNRPNQNVRAGSPPGRHLTIDPNTLRLVLVV
jgi:YD repeat-containing protein